MKTFKQLLEYLTSSEKDEVNKWKKPTKKVISATDHYFGKGVEDKYEPLEGTQDKSEIHKKIERHLGKEISSDDYKSGKTNDVHGRSIRIGKILNRSADSEGLKHEFENDSTRQGKKYSGLTVRTTRSAHGVAGQTSHGQSWEQESCKNFNTGAHRSYLKHEVKRGTVVSYLHDHEGNEIARATLHQHLNDEGHAAYAVDSHYGIDHDGFKKHVEKVAKDLTGAHKGGSILYHKHHDVYDDSGIKTIIHPDATKEHIDTALNDGNVHVKVAAIQHPNATKEHIDKALTDGNAYVKVAAMQHPAATKEHIDKALTDPSDSVRHAAVSHPNATKEHIDKALTDPSDSVRHAAVSHLNATKEHIDKALSDRIGYVKQAAVSHPNATKEHIDKALTDPSDSVKQAAIENPNATKEHIDKALSDGSWGVRRSAIRHPNATKEHIDKALTDPHINVKAAAIQRPNATKEHIDKALSDEDSFIRAAAIQHPAATKEHIDKALNDKDSVVRHAASVKNNIKNRNMW